MIHQRQVVLSDVALAEVLACAETDPAETVVLLWKHCGVDLTDPTIERFQPWSVAIPEDQWQTICKALIRQAVPGVDPASALMFMNKGPAAFKCEEVQR